MVRMNREEFLKKLFENERKRKEYLLSPEHEKNLSSFLKDLSDENNQLNLCLDFFNDGYLHHNITDWEDYANKAKKIISNGGKWTDALQERFNSIIKRARGELDNG